MSQTDNKNYTYRLKTDELVDSIQVKLEAQGIHLPKKDIRAVVDANMESIGDVIVAQLGKFYAVSVKGLGRFSYRLNSGKKHFKTKETVPETITVSFSACDFIRDRLSQAKNNKITSFLRKK